MVLYKYAIVVVSVSFFVHENFPETIILHGGSGEQVEALKGWPNCDWNLQRRSTFEPPTTGRDGNDV